MSARKSQRVNLSPNSIKCEDVVDQISTLVKKIKSGLASKNDIANCKKLTGYLQKFISNFQDIDEFDRWVAKETIEMSNYTCARYERSALNDKI